RERQEDIPELVKEFIKEFGKEYDKPEVSIDDAAMDKILRYSFPGNIRELRHLIEQAVILSEEGLIKARDISIDASKETFNISHSGTIAEMEKKMIKSAMVECGGNLSEVASRLGITRQTLYNKIKRMGL
ncbi:MAG: sigma-54-dependent Fis family transcriptional regulator, partial [Paramuribaculum sp.]|nr:sigma-54-dependent Fis family transcriptional regulator [Paramuribaculum sp.]